MQPKVKEQKKNYQISGLINPFASTQSLSMGSCATDLIHHLDFLNKAENYRRYFVKKLNDEYTIVSTTGKNAYLSNNEFFRSIKDFTYSNPDFISVYYYYLLDILFLLFWPLTLVVTIAFTIRKIAIQ